MNETHLGELLQRGATTRSVGASELQSTSAQDAPHFLVIESASSRTICVPVDGFLLFGRGEDSDVRFDDPSVSWRHARVQVQDGVVRIIDLDSRNGVRVGGVRINGARELAAGEVVSIGEVALILRGGSRARSPRSLLGAEETATRLQHEVERALEYERALSVAVIAPGFQAARPIAAGSRKSPRAQASSWRPTGDLPRDAGALAPALDRALRPMDIAGQTRDGDLVIILPELDPAEARAMIELVIESIAGGWPSARAGVTACPTDGCDGQTLLGGAWNACRARVSGGVATDDDRIVSLALGERIIVLADPTMIRIFALIERLAAADQPVLVVGETGVGKEHAAFAVHHGSRRRSGPFVGINCAAIPDALVESELFGFERGAFSGAQTAKIGLFERASGGTLFLDEIGELSLAAQAKLLRVLEGGRFTRLGEVRERAVDVRVVAATNRDLAAEVRARRFRDDLFYRLSGAVVLIPPLRERPADIPVLALRFLATALERTGKSALAITPAAMLALTRYAWPGNVRELRNAMEYAAVLVHDGAVGLESLPVTILGRDPAADVDSGAIISPGSSSESSCALAFQPIAEELQALERQRMKEALVAAGGVKTQAARLISMPERTFRLKARQYALELARNGDE
jgi:two-component system, NtrC family, response regulator AtoC